MTGIGRMALWCTTLMNMRAESSACTEKAVLSGVTEMTAMVLDAGLEWLFDLRIQVLPVVFGHAVPTSGMVEGTAGTDGYSEKKGYCSLADSG